MDGKILILVAAAGLAAVACQKVTEEPIPEPERPSGPQRVNLTIGALQGAEQGGTRTEVLDDGRVHWLPGEQINVFSAGEQAKFTSINTAETGYARFIGSISVLTDPQPGEDASVFALYPYDASAALSQGAITTTLPSAQTAVNGTFADDLAITAARAVNPFVDPEGDVEVSLEATGANVEWFLFNEAAGTGQAVGGGDEPSQGGIDPSLPTLTLDMYFWNVCSGMWFTVDRSDIKSVTMTATGGEPIAGTFSFDFDSEDLPEVLSVSDPSSSITVTAPDGGTFTPGVRYYIVTLPVTFSLGVTFDFVTESMVGTRTISSTFSLVRSKFSWKQHLDAPVNFVPDPNATHAGDFDYETHSVVYNEEYRAAWVATVNNTDFPKADGAEAQQQDLIDLFTDLKRMGFNAVVFQVNPMADAFWNSQLLPWSMYLTGTQGQDPGYDPLLLAVNTAHALGMELHAWFNPYRIGPTSHVRSESHPMFSHPDWYEVYNDSYYWNPGVPEVRAFVASLMEEVVTNYDVDGTHIDDYFYPSGLYNSTGTWNDTAEYNQYGNGMSRANWRIYNVDQQIIAYQNATHGAKSHVVFGVSPAGNVDNCHRLYAYPEHWLQNGTTDYLTPQIYWDHERTDGADFNTRLNKFLNMQRADNVHMLVGIAPYMVYSAGSQYAFYHNPGELLYQVNKVRSLGLDGTFWYNARSCQKELLTNYIPTNIYPDEALTPSLSQTPASLQAPVVSVSGMALNWSEVQGAENYVVLELTRRVSDPTEWDAAIVHSGTQLTFSDTSSGSYYIVLARSGSKRSGYSQVIYLP